MAKLRFRCVHFKPELNCGATIFLIVAFKSRHWFYRPVIKRLLDSGFNVHVYDYPARPLLVAYPEQWIEFTQAVSDDIAGVIKAERAENPHVRFGIIGASVGSTLALHAAKCIPELERMVFITLYGSSAQLIWENKTLKKMKKRFVKAQKTMQDAFKAFAPMEATTGLERLGQRPILLFVSMDDQVISYSNASRFIQAAIEHDLNFKYRVVSVARHSLAILRTFGNYDAWLPFLSELRDPTLVAQIEVNALAKRMGRRRVMRAAARQTRYVRALAAERVCE